jgi:ubiquinone/menaquinone biosynthesis C-methylase UbiE
LSGKRVLDLGTGPGLVALELAARGANVVGIDIASDQIRAAEDTALDRGLSGSCRFLVRPAEETCLAGASFDLITAGQCWGWFDEARTLREMQRVLAPGGLLAVAHYCYLSRHSDVARTTASIRAASMRSSEAASSSSNSSATTTINGSRTNPGEAGCGPATASDPAG